MAIAIERYLKDFGQPEAFVLAPDLGVAPEPELLSDLEPAPLADIPEEPAIDLEAERAEAYERGSREAAEIMTTAHQEELEAERSRHLEEINEMRTQLEQGFSTTLAARIDQLSGELSESIGEQVARVMAPFLEQALCEKMITQLAGEIAGALSDPETGRIAVSGSSSMFEALKVALGKRAKQLDFTETDAFDLTVRIDDTVFSTRLSEWADTLREVLS